MVEEILLKEQLTKEMIETGARLVDLVTASGIPIRVAMWLFTAEDNKWRSLISSPLAENDPRGVRTRVSEARRSMGQEANELLMFNSNLISVRDELVQAIATEMPVGPTAKPVRLTRGAVGGRYVDDLLVYRSAA